MRKYTRTNALSYATPFSIRFDVFPYCRHWHVRLHAGHFVIPLFLASQLPSLHVRKYRHGRMRRVRRTSIKIHEKYENLSLSLFSCYFSSSTFIRTLNQSRRVFLRYCARLWELWDSYITWEFVWIIEKWINVYVKVSVASEKRCEDCVSRTRIALRHKDLVVRDKKVRRAREILKIVVLWKNASIINPLRINVTLT